MKISTTAIDGVNTRTRGIIEWLSQEEETASELGGEAMFDYRRTIVSGLLVLLLSFGSFLIWANFAPLTSAAIAPGMVKVLGERQSLQHLEGGIIKEILVEEGSVVSRGQVLMRLDPTQPDTTRELLEGRLLNLQVTEARLRAERDGTEFLRFPEALVARADALDEASILDGEQRVFQSRLEARRGQLQIMEQRIERFRDEIKAYQAQRRAGEEQLALTNEELDAVTVIYEKGIYEKPKYLALKRSVAGLEGKIGELEALVARTEQRIGETRLEIIDFRNQWVSEAASELQAVSARILDIMEQQESVDDVLQRLAIFAPRSGVVVGLQYHTVGGVVGPGAKIMDIVPTDAVLVVEARVRPEDIDVVATGLDCDVQLSAYSRRSTPKIPGKVKQVSADSFYDEMTQRSYYRAQIEVDAATLNELDGVSLYPGMTVEVFIKTGRRSIAEYLLEPVMRSLDRSLRE